MKILNFKPGRIFRGPLTAIDRQLKQLLSSNHRLLKLGDQAFEKLTGISADNIGQKNERLVITSGQWQIIRKVDEKSSYILPLDPEEKTAPFSPERLEPHQADPDAAIKSDPVQSIVSSSKAEKIIFKAQKYSLKRILFSASSFISAMVGGAALSFAVYQSLVPSLVNNAFNYYGVNEGFVTHILAGEAGLGAFAGLSICFAIRFIFQYLPARRQLNMLSSDLRESSKAETSKRSKSETAQTTEQNESKALREAQKMIELLQKKLAEKGTLAEAGLLDPHLREVQIELDKFLLNTGNLLARKARATKSYILECLKNKVSKRSLKQYLLFVSKSERDRVLNILPAQFRQELEWTNSELLSELSDPSVHQLIKANILHLIKVKTLDFHQRKQAREALAQLTGIAQTATMAKNILTILGEEDISEILLRGDEAAIKDVLNMIINGNLAVPYEDLDLTHTNLESLSSRHEGLDALARLAARIVASQINDFWKWWKS
jgi:hypothetical protein